VIGHLSYETYKYKFRLIASHRPGDGSSELPAHAHAFELDIYVLSRPQGESEVAHQEIEDIVLDFLAQYEEKILNDIPPFDIIPPTIENIAEVCYKYIKDILAKHNFTLLRVEVSETPARTCMVGETPNQGDFRSNLNYEKISNVLMQNIKAISNRQALSSVEKKPIDENNIFHTEAPDPEPKEHHKPQQKKIEHLTPITAPISIETLETPAKRLTLQLIAATIFLLLVGAALTFYIKNSGIYPSGADIFGHIFKSDFLYNSIKEGNFYPLFTQYWYNGLQPFRYWAPLPYYLLAAMQFITGGDALDSYLLFIFFAFFVGGMGWLLWGKKHNKILLCTIFAILWFFLIDNTRVFFSEGNLPRMVITVLLPYLFYYLWEFLEYKKDKAIISLIILTVLAAFCHAMIAAMVGVASFIFVLVYCIAKKEYIRGTFTIVAMMLSFAVSGIWLYSALKGGLVSMNTTAVMAALTYPITVSLNPFLRLQGHVDFYYYGLSVLVISIIGFFIAGKKSRPGFFTPVVIFLGTTTALLPFLQKLPLNQLLWMMRMSPIAYALFLIGLLEWKNCRRYILLIFLCILVLDTVPSDNLPKYFSQISSQLVYSLNDAKAITNQRIALMDNSTFGAYPSYAISSTEPRTQYAYGWSWQGASTAQNIMLLNTALEKGYYIYLFDRCFEMGNDTVLVCKSMIPPQGFPKADSAALIKAAAKSGYELYEETNYVYIFHKETPKTFGVNTEYTGFAIGVSAVEISLFYPCFEAGTDTYIEYYNVDELSKYKVIYLSGFFYKDRSVAEGMVRELANRGVRVVIDMNRIPVDSLTNRMTFLDVTAQPISFTGSFPALMCGDKIYQSLPFDKEYKTWNTVYLENFKNAIGYSWFENKKINFFGDNGYKNIYFMGFNLFFHTTETNDPKVTELMNVILGQTTDQLPKREAVAIDVKYSHNNISIDSPIDDINTTIAYQDNFQSDQKIINANHLLTVEKGHTEIHIVYPYLTQGLITSILGITGVIILLKIIRKRGEKIQ